MYRKRIALVVALVFTIPSPALAAGHVGTGSAYQRHHHGSGFASRAATADRDFWAVLKLAARDLRITCRARRRKATCHDAAYAVWFAGQPASWSVWTDRVVAREHRLVVFTVGGAEV